ncbi:MAG: DUF1080 domain-containing protein [Bryobacteraceae bacterium]
MASIGRFARAGLLIGLLPGSGGLLAEQASGEWISLFDGKTLRNWKETPFSGGGAVAVKDGAVVLGRGQMTGITWTGEFPRSGYEIRFEAARLEGKDFFAGLTFPVKETFCTWINGGWDGTVVGLSNLDGYDASENDTSTVREFAPGQWYSFRLMVTENRIRAWIDGVAVIDADLTGRQVGLRFDETDLSAPLGFASYATVGGVRRVEYRRLPMAEANR